MYNKNKFVQIFGILLSLLVLSGCQPNTPGTVSENDPGLIFHTIYRPENLDTLTGKLPIVVWGEGGCILPGDTFAPFLSRIAKAEYLVIASNGIGQLGLTNSAMLIDAIDWATLENSREGSPYYDKIDTSKVAVMGQSCGGLQALHVGSDDRITTVVAWNSGIFDRGSMGGATKADLLLLHTPTMWVNSGPRDIAYPQAEKDFAEVPDYIPAVWANYDLSERGGTVFGAHMSTYFEAGGGEFGRAAVLWLDFMLKGVEANRAQFIGDNCGLCASSPKWSVQAKNW